MANNKNKVMNENINLVEILKDAPRGTKLWSPLCGECEFIDILPNDKVYQIKIGYKKEIYPHYYYITSKGKFIDGSEAECLLFPSKDNRDWSTFKALWKHKHFEPFQKVLVKSYDAENAKDIWTPSLYGCYVSEIKKHCSVAGVWYKDGEILPYEGNEDKLGKPVEK